MALIALALVASVTTLSDAIGRGFDGLTGGVDRVGQRIGAAGTDGGSWTKPYGTSPANADLTLEPCATGTHAYAASGRGASLVETCLHCGAERP